MIISVKNKAQLVVPASVSRRAGIRTGDRIEFKISGRVISIVPHLPNTDDEYTPTQRHAIMAELSEGLEDIKQGRTYGPFSTAKAMVFSMKRELKKMARIKRKPHS